MIDLSSLLVSSAWAQNAAPSTETSSALMNLVPFILIFAVFYFLVIRPQQKKIIEHDKMIKALKIRDCVVTSGGLHGTIVSIDEASATMLLQIADGVKVKVNRDSVTLLDSSSTKKDDDKAAQA
ncbi:MAG: preprotein translocase subunit YajC [Alphaproteobacteria bacterium]|nr:preprotein translocase subunit YajC [Alphaproteobacteria bacterium]